MAIKKSSIQASERLKKFLADNSSRKGETYEEIIWRLLGQKTLTKEQTKYCNASYEEFLKG